MSVRVKMPAVISEPQCAELVVDQQEAEAAVQKATVPRDVRLSLFKSQYEDLINYLQTNECRPELSKNEARNIKDKAATHKFNSASKCFCQIRISLLQYYTYIHAKNDSIFVAFLR